MTEQHPQFQTLSPPPPTAKPGKSRVIPITITIVCGLLLAGGSCFGFIATLNINGPGKPINIVFGWGIAAGALLFLAGIIWGIVAMIVHIFRPKKEQP